MLIVLERLDTEECQELTLVSKLAKILNLKISLLSFHRDPNSINIIHRPSPQTKYREDQLYGVWVKNNKNWNTILVTQMSDLLEIPRFSLETPIFHWRPPYFRWRRPYFYLTPHIFIRHPHIFIRHSHIFIRHPIFLLDTPIFLLDTPIFSLESPIFSLETFNFCWIPPFQSTPPSIFP